MLLFGVVHAGQPRGLHTWLHRLRLSQRALRGPWAFPRLCQYLSHFALINGCCLVVLIVDVSHEVLVVVFQLVYEFQKALNLPFKCFGIVAQLVDHSLEVGVLSYLLEVRLGGLLVLGVDDLEVVRELLDFSLSLFQKSFSFTYVLLQLLLKMLNILTLLPYLFSLHPHVPVMLLQLLVLPHDQLQLLLKMLDPLLLLVVLGIQQIAVLLLVLEHSLKISKSLFFAL